MVKKSNISCPQCLHQNPNQALKCSLCDWPLTSEISDETRMPEANEFEIDPNVTTLANLGSSEKIDPDLTQAPLSENIKSINTHHSVAEKQTFHFAGDLAHFEIHEVLGQGGMGAVYHAKDLTLHRDVAIKMLRPMQASSQSNTEALLDEARMASKLNHPNIVTIYDVARTKDSNYIVMEWVDGQALDEIIPCDGLELEKAMEYACQIADGLSSAHQKYIIHRDIKPQNIMLSSDNTIKILDFGIAGMVNQLNGEDSDDSESTQSSTGTPSYMSPEQAQGLNLDQRSDIFSFGIVLYQMLCGKRPFVGKNLSELKGAICKGNYIPIQKHLSDLPANIILLVEKMLATQKDQRIQSSAELADDLDEIYKALTYQKNWWERRHWFSKVAIILPFVLTIGWSGKEILFPASTQQLIERQLQEANKIAILPFDNISGDPQIQLFADGLAVNLGSDLAAIASHQGNTWIVPSTEISHMKDQSVKKVADKYGVNLILTGSIQHMGSTRLLVLNLINAKDGQQLNTAEVSIDADQLFQGHGLVREKALALLNWEVPESLSAQFQMDRPQIDGAYKEYLKGIGYLYRHDQLDNINNALESFQRAIEIDPSYQSAYVGIAETHLIEFVVTQDINRIRLMEETIDQLIDINHKHSMLDYLSGKVLILKGQYELAEELLKRSIKNNPKHVESYFELGKAYEKLRKYKKTEEIYSKIRKITPHNILEIINLGVIYFKRGEYESAINQFQLLTKVAPNNHWAYSNLGASYYSIDKIDEAIKYTEVALKLKPIADSYSNLGTMYFYQKDYKNAVVAYEKMIDLNSTDYVQWGNIADAYKLTNNPKSELSYQKAVDLAQQSLNLNPNNSTVIADLAYYQANIGNFEEAMMLSKKIDQDNNGVENFYVAAAYSILNEKELAFIHLNYAIDKNYSLEEIKQTPLLYNLNQDKRFQSLGTSKIQTH